MKIKIDKKMLIIDIAVLISVSSLTAIVVLIGFINYHINDILK